MNISGILVRTHAHNVEDVGEALRSIAGVELHACNPDGRMVVTIEAEDSGRSTEIFTRINDVDDVLCTSVIYHCFDEPIAEGGTRAVVVEEK